MPLSALEHLRALWDRERRAARERAAEARRGLTLSERVLRGLALADLHIVDEDPAPGGRRLLWVAPRKVHADPDDVKLGPGDPVRLWLHDPDEAGAVRGVVARRTGTRLGVMVDVEASDALEHLDGASFRLDLDTPEVTFDRGDRAIRRFQTLRPGTDPWVFGAALLGDRPPVFGQPGVSRFFDAHLNECQRAAVDRAMRADDVALVHGPPGTGKTRTLVEIVRQAVARGERVLATAASNGAVDNLGLRLRQAGVSVVRLGHPARISPELEAASLDCLLAETEAWQLAHRWNQEAGALRRRAAARAERGALERGARREALLEARRLQSDAHRHLEAAQTALLGRIPVVLATAAGAEATVLGDRPGDYFQLFDRIVVDEATQSPDPITLVALQRGHRAVLAGDPCQLPPTVLDPEAEAFGLGVTLFERIAESCPAAVTLLRVQHRMPVELMAFPSDSMYDGALEAAPEVAHARLGDLAGVRPDPWRPEPLCFVDTAGMGYAESRSEADPSTCNPGQAGRTVREVRRLLARGLPPADIGVITPYEAQARRLREALRDARREGLDVGTVDAFQGREKEAIVVDLVRSNEAGELGFLNDRRRMNVALTRARRFLLVIGDSATLGAHPYYRRFLDAADAGGAWISAWADDGEPGPDLSE